MTILDKIIAFKKTEIAKIKAEVHIKKLVESPNFGREVFSLKKIFIRSWFNRDYCRVQAPISI